MKQKRFSRKDAKPIRDDAVSSLQELPVSSRAVLLPVKVEPAVPAPAAPARTPNHVVRLLNKNTNVIVALGFKAAQWLSKNSPQQYQILS